MAIQNLREYPLTDSDLISIGQRMALGEARYIPVRRDRVLENGKILENSLIWRHPSRYRIERVMQGYDVLYYGRPIE